MSQFEWNYQGKKTEWMNDWIDQLFIISLNWVINVDIFIKWDNWSQNDLFKWKYESIDDVITLIKLIEW